METRVSRPYAGQADLLPTIDLVGTRLAYRRLGLGRAILLAGLQQLKTWGADRALLGTASWNTEAQRLFAAANFRLLHQIRWYAWAEEA